MSLPPGRPAALTYLIVDDDPGDIMMIADILESLAGSRVVHSVGDGREALDFLRRVGRYADAPRPDVILLDLNMPRMDGRETLTAIKAAPALRTIPVVVFSTSTADSDVDACLSRYANAYVAKPVEFSQLESALQAIDGFFGQLAQLGRPASALNDESSAA
ncbi:response regulator [Spongisporangium articulatum]|uniref:Response regulator n=1 Tax=Spongisporangium articulatum TaxID=3362603 RepID=A0ABW8AQ28_9ACTN